MARMASICSVTFMDPSSLAMPLELRPATIKPVSTGPSSRTMESDTSCPVSDSEPNCCSVLEVCNASTAPVKKPVSTTMGSEPTPIRSACMMRVAEIARTREDVADGATGEQGIVLHRRDLFLRKLSGREDCMLEPKSAITEIYQSAWRNHDCSPLGFVPGRGRRQGC